MSLDQRLKRRYVLILGLLTGLGAVTVDMSLASIPQMAAALAKPLTRWRRIAGREEMMRDRLLQLQELPGLSPDVFEVVSKSLRD